MATWIVLAAICIVPVRGGVISERVSILEINHFYDENGRLVFDQLVGWEWKFGRFEVIDWRLAKSPAYYPQRDWKNGGWYVLFFDGERLRRIVSPHYRETWTQEDIELVERDVLPKERRRGFRK